MFKNKKNYKIKLIYDCGPRIPAQCVSHANGELYFCLEK